MCPTCKKRVGSARSRPKIRTGSGGARGTFSLAVFDQRVAIYHLEFGAAILLATRGGLVVGLRGAIAITLGRETTLHVRSGAQHEGHHRVGATLAERLVGGHAAHVVGVTAD